MRSIVIGIVVTLAPTFGCNCGGPVGVEGEGEGEGEQNPNAPAVTIVAPDDGSAFARGQSITFTCNATDPQDGAVPNGDIRWASSADGQIGIGATIQTALVSAGAHTVTCAATDTDGNVGTDTIGISIVDNFAPEVTIEAPADGSFFSVDQTVTFRGSAIDAEDGALVGADLVWMDGQGQLGAGAVVTTALPLGDHTITLVATDSEGALGNATIVIHVVDNLPPVCTIRNPGDGDQIAKDSSVTFSADCIDPDGVGLIGNASVAWQSDRQGPLGVGFSVTQALVVAGAHVISVCAEDTEDPAVLGCDSITVDVVSAPTVTITAPTDGATLADDASVAFSGTAVDDEDGALVPTWNDSLAGDFATGNGASLTLLTGKHVITLSAVDSSGLRASDAITLFATPGGAAFATLFDSRALGSPVTDLLFDPSSGTLWASTDGGGLVEIALDLSASFAFMTGNSSVPNNQVNGVAAAQNGDLFVASDDGLGTSCDPNTLAGCVVFRQGQLALDTSRITAVVVLPGGRVVVGTDQCLMFSDFAQDQHQRYCDGDSGLRGDEVRALALDPASGGVYVVTNDGVTLMTPGNGVDNASFTRIDLGVGDVSAVAVAPSGAACFASNDGVAVRDGGTRRFDQNDGLPDNDVRDVAIDVVTVNGSAHDICWAATAGGLGRIDLALSTVTALTANDGLPTNDCRAIAVLPDHTKVVGTNTGVFSYAGL